MPSIAQSLDYRVDVGIIFIRLVRNACHDSIKLWRKNTKLINNDFLRFHAIGGNKTQDIYARGHSACGDSICRVS